MSRVLNSITDGINPSDRVARKLSDLKYGGQFGLSEEIGFAEKDGTFSANWMSNQAFISGQTIAVVLEAPEFFEFMPNKTVLVESLKALIELHAEKIDGLETTLTVETASHELNGSGAVVMDEVVRVTETRAEPTFTFREKLGRSIQRFLNLWIIYGIGDPHNRNIPRVTQLPGYDANANPWNEAMSGATILFFETDITHTRVEAAWLAGGCKPTSDGGVTSRKDLTASGEMKEYSIKFTSLMDTTENAMVIAQTWLDALVRNNFNVDTLPTFVNGVDADLRDDKAQAGFNLGSGNAVK